VVDVDFPEDVYLNHADFWCPSQCAKKQSSTCDYTTKSKGDCRGYSNSSSCPSHLCTTNKKWEALEEGKERDDSLFELGASIEYRFLHIEPCSSLRILVVPTKGQAKLEVATPMTWRNFLLQDNTTANSSFPEEQRSFQTPWLYHSDKKGYQELSICPSDPIFELGTFFFKVTSTTNYVSYQILVESSPFRKFNFLLQTCVNFG
jgi:hypothetical protein